MPRPTDIVCDHPDILFVGINPGATSGKVGHHFAGPGNPFYKLLHAARLTPIELAAVADGRLPEWNLALVNLCARPTRQASELSRAELHAGRRELLAKIDAMQPRVVALVGVTLYPIVFAGTPKAELVPGAGAKPQRLAGARVFVVPNPSGLNATFPTFAAKLPWFRKLRAFAYGRGKPAAAAPTST